MIEFIKKQGQIFVAFFKVGLLTIGGGFAMLPILEAEVSDRKKWLSIDEVLECYSLSQSVPGVIAANTAAFAGYKMGGILGAVSAVLGVISPSILIIIIVAQLYADFINNPYILKAFNGIRVVVLALLFKTFVSMVKKAIHGPFTAVIASFSFLLVLLADISPVLIIGISAIIGILHSKKNEKVD